MKSNDNVGFPLYIQIGTLNRYVLPYFLNPKEISLVCVTVLFIFIGYIKNSFYYKGQRIVTPPQLYFVMECSGNDLILLLFCQLIEVYCVSRHTNGKLRILLWVNLCIFQKFWTNHINV